MKHNQPPEDEGESKENRPQGWLARWLEYFRAGNGQVPLTEGDLVAYYDVPELNVNTQVRPQDKPLAKAALNVWRRNIYRPEVLLHRASCELLARPNPPGIGSFETFYMSEANDRLHAQTGPVMVAEAFLPVPSTETSLCGYCNKTFFGQVVSRITAAQCATDISFGLDHYRGNLPNNLVQIREPVMDEIAHVEFTEFDEHTLESHGGLRAATKVADKIFSLQRFMTDPVPMLEDPRYLPQPPEQRS